MASAFARTTPIRNGALSARSNTPPVLSTQRMRMSESIRRPPLPQNDLMGTPQKRSGRRMSTGPPPAPTYTRMTADIATMLSIKDKIEEMLTKSQMVIEQNNTTPEIEAILSPSVRQLEQSYPIFHRQGTHYFTTLTTMQESAKTHQVLSSASVRIPLEQFIKDWKNFTEIVDRLADSHPPPHAKEISTKFKAIRSALDTIQQTNERRKHPSLSLSKCIWSIEALGESLTKNIIELFSQPSFPNFQTDLNASFRTDIRSFLTVVNDAFTNEFVQSGVMLCDLSRIKSNIFTDCNEIIEALKSAFVFPKQMQEIQMIKNTAEGELTGVLMKLSVPFAVIKPSDATIAAAALEEARSKPLQEIDNAIDRDEFIPEPPKVDDATTILSKVDDFIKLSLELLGSDIVFTNDTWDNLTIIREKIHSVVELSKEQKEHIKQLSLEIKQLRESHEEKEILYSSRCDAMNDVAGQQSNKFLELQDQYNKMTERCSVLEYKLHSKDEEILELKNKGDPEMLRKGLIDVASSILYVMDTPKEQFDLPDNDLIERVKQIQFSYLGRKCEGCKKYEAAIDSIAEKLRVMVDKDLSSSSPDYLIAQLENKMSELNGINTSLKDDNEKIRTEIIEMLKLFPNSKEMDLETIQRLDNKGLKFALLDEIKSIIQSNENVTKSAAKKEENYIKTFKQVSEKLSKILNDNKQEEVVELGIEDISVQRTKIIEIISSQLKEIRNQLHDVKKDEQEMQQKLTQYENDHKKFINTIVSQLNFTPDLNDVESQIINQIATIQAPFENQIDDLKSQIGDLNSEIQTLNARITGICPKDVNIDSSLSDIDQIYKKLEIIQDHTDSTQSCFTSLDSSNALFRKSMLSIRKQLLPSDQTLQNDISDANLVLAVQKLIDKIAGPFFSEDFVKVSEINEMFKEVFEINNSIQSESPKTYIPVFCKIFASNEKGFLALTPLIHQLNTLHISIDGNEEAYAEIPTRPQVQMIKATLDKIATSIPNMNLVTVLYKLMALSMSLV